MDVRTAAGRFEDTLDTVSFYVKPYLPATARFLLVVTFLEDSLRIASQWSDQLYYLQRHRGFPWGLSHAFLLLNVLFMIACSFLAITKRRTEFAVGGLFSVIIAQSLGYGLLFDSGFFFRNLSVVGGLLMLLADAWATGSRKKMLPGLPALSEDAKAAYLQLAGRILLVFLFLGFVFAGEWSAPRIVVSIVALFGCGMVAIGFQTRWATWVLIAFLSVSNVVLNNWWSLHHSHPQRDFLKYDFFQTLSIMGGFLLLANMGPGGISVDEKKKAF